MREHIINFAIDIEDDRIANIVEEKAAKQIMNDLKLEIFNRLLEGTYYRKAATLNNRDNKVEIDSSSRLNDWVQDMVKTVLEDNKEEIINRAVDKIANSYVKSKSFKEKIDKKLD